MPAKFVSTMKLYLLNKSQLAPVLSLALLLSIAGCSDKKPAEQANTQTPAVKVNVPEFNQDSAFAQVARQVAFGPRVPGSKAHTACGDYLLNTLKAYGWQVQEQPFDAKVFTGTTVKGRNIIASFMPENPTRILLAAHWDTRPFADQDSVNQNKPIDGANDGGSGVGVLLELARVLATATEKPKVGVDIIFFDVEDYGDTDDYQPKEGEEPGQWWCLGSKYWSQNKHKPNYSAYYGILLDMVGAPNARFAQEGVSLQFAPLIVDRVWNNAAAAGFGQYFDPSPVAAITDDHVYVNRYAKINMIDIIEHDPSDGQFFSKTWHKHSDNLENIDPKTLKAVGQTLLFTLYHEQP